MSTLHIFDFDDTLINSTANVKIIKKDGKEISLSSEEYAKYVEEPGDVFDFSDFDSYPGDANIIEPVFAELRAAIALDGPSNVVILTARSNRVPVELFLENNDITGIEIEAVGSSNPMAKARYVLDRVKNENFDEVRIFEDNVRNIRTVQKVIEKTGVKLVSSKVENGSITRLDESDLIFPKRLKSFIYNKSKASI